MKRFLLFAGSNYYPDGGWDDLQGDFDSLSEACKESVTFDWAHVIDSSDLTLAFVNDWEGVRIK